MTGTCSRLLWLALAALLGCSDGQEPTASSRIGSITFLDDTVTIETGGVYSNLAEVRDTAGEPVVGPALEWGSAHPEVATVEPDGLVRGAAPGSTEVSAAAEGVVGTFTVIVVPSRRVSLELSPDELALPPSSAAQVTTVFRDASGNLDPVTDFREVVWSSSDSTLATVRSSENPEGVARAVIAALRPGQAVVTARRGTLDASITVTASAERFITIAAGSSHACAVTASRQALCWGSASVGELGGGLPDLRCGQGGYCSPVPLVVRGDHRFERLAPGPRHTCGLSAAGEAFCWGGGVANDIRPGVYCDRVESGFEMSCVPEPSRIELASPAVALAPGVDHGCVLDVAGAVRCWGDGRRDRLGTVIPGFPACSDPGTLEEFPCSRDPIPIDDPARYTNIATGFDHTCGLTAAGDARCWGVNDHGQLGTGAVTDQELPGTVAGGLHFQEVDAGAAHTCGIADGEAYCWGSNDSGQLGSVPPGPCGDDPQVACEPLRVEGHAFAHVAAGGGHTCALDVSGAAWCWGRNASGELGTGTSEPSPLPVPVTGGLTFREISAGGRFTCGLTTAGVAYCWGFGGVIGDGGPDRSVPTRVPGQP